MGLSFTAYNIDWTKRKKDPTSRANDPIVTKMNLIALLRLYNAISFSYR